MDDINQEVAAGNKLGTPPTQESISNTGSGHEVSSNVSGGEWSLGQRDITP